MTTNTPQGLTGGPLTNEQATKAPREAQTRKRPANSRLDIGTYCGRGICAAEEGHEGTCAEASGWADGGKP